MLSGSQDKSIKLWNIVTDMCLSTFNGHTAPITTKKS